MTVQTVSNPDPKLAEKGESEKEPVKSLKALKDYKIPKLVKNGDSDNKIESKSESSISSVETKTTEEDNGQNGEGDVEPMETDENCLSDAQVSDRTCLSTSSLYMNKYNNNQIGFHSYLPVLLEFDIKLKLCVEMKL